MADETSIKRVLHVVLVLVAADAEDVPSSIVESLLLVVEDGGGKTSRKIAQNSE